MSHTDPEPLSSLANAPELTDALHAARERLPDANALEALRARVEAAGSAGVAPAKRSGRWSVALKIVLPLLGVAGAIVASPHLAPRADAPLPPDVPSASVIVAVPAKDPAPNPTLPLPPPVASASAPLARRSASPFAPSAVAPALTPEVSSELDLVKRAGKVLKSDPAQALQLTMEHARLYPSGALSEEREVIAIEALAHLGRSGAARSRAERFMAAFPRSAHLSRVEQATALDSDISDAGDQKKLPPAALHQQ